MIRSAPKLYLDCIKNARDLYLHGLGTNIRKFIDLNKSKINKSKRLVYYWIKNRRPINIADLIKITTNIQFLYLLKKAKYISAYESPHLIKLPSKLTRDLAYLCGYHMGDGCITRNNLQIYYMDTREQLIKISDIYRKNFGISLKIKKHATKGAFTAVITSKALAYLLHYCLSLPIGKKKKLFLPHWIDSKLKKEFIIGFLDAEFGIKRKEFEFSGSSIDKNFLCKLQKELIKLGLDLKLYGPYSSHNDPNPRWFLKTSKVSDMYLLAEEEFIRHPNNLKVLNIHILNHAPVV